jgi:hypothetical protein
MRKSIVKLKAESIKVKVILGLVLVVVAFHACAQTQTSNYVRKRPASAG